MKPHRSHWLLHGLSHRLAVLTAAFLLTCPVRMLGRGSEPVIEPVSMRLSKPAPLNLTPSPARVYIRLYDGYGIRLRAEGPKRWISDLVRRTEARVLVVNAGSQRIVGQYRGRSGCSGRNPHRVPGHDVERRVAEAPPEVELFVPPKAPR